MKNNIVQIVSYNCQGLQSPEKRKDVLDYLKSKTYRITYIVYRIPILQKKMKFLLKICGEENVCLIHTGHQRGVAILFNNNFEHKILNNIKDQNGNFLAINLIIAGKNVTLINIYSPNNDCPTFFSKVSDVIENFDNNQSLLLVIII